MNPYLEHPVLWREIHKRLIVAIADYLSPQVRPVFIVVIQERVYKDVDYDAVFVDNRDVAVKDSQITEKSEKGNNSSKYYLLKTYIENLQFQELCQV